MWVREGLLSRAPKHHSFAHAAAPQRAHSLQSLSHPNNTKKTEKHHKVKPSPSKYTKQFLCVCLKCIFRDADPWLKAKADSKMKCPHNHAKQMLKLPDFMSCASWFCRDAAFASKETHQFGVMEPVRAKCTIQLYNSLPLLGRMD